MDPNDRKRFKILITLLAVLAATVWVGREIYQVPSGESSNLADTATGSEPDGAESLMTGGLEVDRLSGESIIDNGTGRNPFQYGSEPVLEVSESEPSVPLTPEPENSSRPPAVVAPPSAPPPPPIPLSYNGYAYVDLSGEMSALLFDSDNSFVVSAQEVVMGRYRINTVTEEFVEIEDLEFGRRQRLPLIVQ